MVTTNFNKKTIYVVQSRSSEQKPLTNDAVSQLNTYQPRGRARRLSDSIKSVLSDYSSACVGGVQKLVEVNSTNYCPGGEKANTVFVTGQIRTAVILFLARSPETN